MQKQITNEAFQNEFDICVLGENEHVDMFSCGDEDLDDFILNESPAYTKAKISVTHVVVRKIDGQVVAYFSLANDKLSVNDFNSNSEFNRFRKRRFTHEKQIKSYPAVKLCRLGIATTEKGQGLGSFLLNIVCAMFTNNNHSGCRFLTVDAYKTAVPFYEKNGFDLLTKRESRNETIPLYYDLASF